jgi:hypothetical protein
MRQWKSDWLLWEDFRAIYCEYARMDMLGRGLKTSNLPDWCDSKDLYGADEA